MDIFSDMERVVAATLAKLAEEGAIAVEAAGAAFDVDAPRDDGFGEVTTNAALAAAGLAGLAPRSLAALMAPLIETDPRVAEVAVAGPGFINLRLEPEIWRSCMAAAIAAGPDYGRCAEKRGRANVEFISANPAGPLHVGHARSAVFGDALANLLSFAGWDVVREYYVNDGGAQMDVLARAAHQAYAASFDGGACADEAEEGDDYLAPVVEALREAFGASLAEAPEAEWLAKVRAVALERMLALIREDMGALGLEMDAFSSERALMEAGAVDAALRRLDEHGHIYVGVLPPPEGRSPDFWETRPQTLFRSSAFGDEMDRPVRKTDGAWTYFASDVAYHYDKIERGFDRIVDVLGDDHGAYVGRVKAAVSALSEGRSALEVHLVKRASLRRSGAPWRGHAAEDAYPTLRDLVDEIGADAVRFALVARRADQALVVEMDDAADASLDNPHFAIQYAHARIRAAIDGASAADVAGDPARLEGATGELARKVAAWPQVVRKAAESGAPHRAVGFLHDLARIAVAALDEAPPEGDAARDARRRDERIAAHRAVSVVICAGLGILGVTPATQMR